MSQLQLPTQNDLNDAMKAAGLEPNEPAGTADTGGKGELKTPTKAMGIRVALVRVMPVSTAEELYALHSVFSNDIGFLAPQDWSKTNHGLQPLGDNPTAKQRVYFLSRLAQVQEYQLMLAIAQEMKTKGITQKVMPLADIDPEQYPAAAAMHRDSEMSLLFTQKVEQEITISPTDTLAMLDDFMGKKTTKRGK